MSLAVRDAKVIGQGLPRKVRQLLSSEGSQVACMSKREADASSRLSLRHSS